MTSEQWLREQHKLTKTARKLRAEISKENGARLDGWWLKSSSDWVRRVRP